MTDVKHPANYAGNDSEVKKWMDQADGYAKEMSRLRREGKSTIKADDKLEIMEVVCLWDNAFDAQDKRGLIDLMTEDCVYTSNAWPPAHGHEGVGQWWDTFTQTFYGKRHIITNFTIFGDDKEAYCYSYLHVMERVNHCDNIATTVYYDKFVKRDGRWLIKDRVQILDTGMNYTKQGQELYAHYLETLK